MDTGTQSLRMRRRAISLLLKVGGMACLNPPRAIKGLMRAGKREVEG